MLLRIQHNAVRFLLIMIVACTLAVTMSNLRTPAAHAATVTTATTTQAHMPALGLFWHRNNGQTRPAGSNYSYNLSWESGSAFKTNFDAIWGDGNTDDYTCWLNCGSGVVTWQHFYQRDGTYHNHGTSSGVDSNSDTVFVVG